MEQRPFGELFWSPSLSKFRPLRLPQEGMLDCLQLLHYHVGSQVADIAIIKEAMREGSHLYCELATMGAAMVRRPLRETVSSPGNPGRAPQNRNDASKWSHASTLGRACTSSCHSQPALRTFEAAPHEPRVGLQGYIDVGGGLGIDYDGTKGNRSGASTNYSMQASRDLANHAFVPRINRRCDRVHILLQFVVTAKAV